MKTLAFNQNESDYSISPIRRKLKVAKEYIIICFWLLIFLPIKINAQTPQNKLIEFFKQPFMQVLKTEELLADSSMKNFFAFYEDDSCQILSLGNGFFCGKYKILQCSATELKMMVADSLGEIEMIVKAIEGIMYINIPSFKISDLKTTYLPVEDFHYLIRRDFRKFLTTLKPVKYDNRGNALNSEVPDIPNRFMIGQQSPAVLRMIDKSTGE